MFTGIVEELGTVVAVGERLVIRTKKVGADSYMAGASIAVNGVCLTVVDSIRRTHTPDVALKFDLSPETLDRSSLGRLEPGDGVNLERPVTLVTRLGGHLVQGQVDGVGEIRDIDDDQQGRTVT